MVKILFFMSRHFDETISILIAFFRFGALKISTGDYFVIRINTIILLKTKKWNVLFIQYFWQHFPQIMFSPILLYREA